MGKTKPTRAKKHASIEFFTMMGITTHMAPVGLHVYAVDFLAAAHAIAPPKVPLTPARTYLVCHALELALKAFLSVKGLSLDELAGGAYGHDLGKLLTKAEDHGLAHLVQLDAAHRDEIRLASDYYLEKVFEYPALMEAITGAPKNPDTNVLLSVAKVLIAALREPCFNSPIKPAPNTEPEKPGLRLK